ncbi:hypothetical protein ONE63_002121 [Megalurothrips usitatus]|uniref:ubiquitinyl hydrolase 1 n=1 Tax=Megalurothrips usitatus TaxID=439358 RepID=A0AAV7XE80_9NEOP|nr:hypothetical protein ONE63_002121 [Megalurothrips usitatus]
MTRLTFMSACSWDAASRNEPAVHQPKRRKVAPANDTLPSELANDVTPGLRTKSAGYEEPSVESVTHAGEVVSSSERVIPGDEHQAPEKTSAMMLCYDLDFDNEFEYTDVFEQSNRGNGDDRAIVRALAFWKDGDIVTKLLNPGSSTDHVFPQCKTSQNQDRKERVDLLKAALYRKYGGPQYDPYRVLDFDLLSDDDVQCFQFYTRELNGLPRDAVGIPNVGNTCYINAFLQLINSVPELKDAILCFPEAPAGSGENVLECTSFMAALREFFLSLENGAPEPVPFVDLLLRQFQWPDNSCNDLSETMHRIMVIIREALNLVGRSFDAFDGALVCSLSCPDEGCGNTRYKNESTMGLTLELRATLTLQDF